jgi:osmotically-inducible protein OsmY
MARAGWAVVTATVLVVSYVACQNTWRGLKQDTQKNTALAEHEAKEMHLDEKARAVDAEAREVAERADARIKRATGELGERPDELPATPGPTSSAPSTAAREVNEAIGKVAAKAKEVGEDVAREAKAAAIHLDVEQALVRDPAVDASHIDIHVDDETRTIVLSGAVPNAAQKTAARRITFHHAHGYEVRNELAVGN